MASQAPGQHYRLDQLADGVYAAIASSGGAAVGNAGIVDLGNATLVVDTFVTPTAAEDLRADAARLTGRLPRWVVNTHYHNDHIWGNQVFLPDADVISTVETRALIQTAGQEEYDYYRAISADRLKQMESQRAAAPSEAQRAALDLMIAYFRGMVQDFPRLQVTLPNVLFEGRMVLHGTRRRAELIAFSGAHSGSDAVVYLPDDGIVFMSDLLFVGFHPYVGDGDPDLLLNVLHSILDGSAGIPRTSRFVPGHGPVAAASDLEVLAAYIEQCRQAAQELVSTGKTADSDVAAAPILAAYKDWTMPRFYYANLGFMVHQQRGTASPAGEPAARGTSNSFRP